MDVPVALARKSVCFGRPSPHCVVQIAMKPLVDTEPLSRTEKETFAWGLANGCPVGTELPNCPLAAVRMLPLKERYAMVRAMSDLQLDEILTHHTQCVGRRLAKL